MRGGKVVPLRERFDKKVEKTASCWLWVGTVDPDGYGQLRRGHHLTEGEREYAGPGSSPSIRAHRLSWAFYRGEIPEGMCVLHNCPGGDNPACVNPSHLWLGTNVQNTADRCAKGRSARGDRTRPETRAKGDRSAWRLYPRLVPRGEKNSHAKLNDVAVRVIRLLCARGADRSLLARVHGVEPQTIWKIATRRQWRHIA